MSVAPNCFPWGLNTNQRNIKDGTSCLQTSPIPGTAGLSIREEFGVAMTTPNYFGQSALDVTVPIRIPRIPQGATPANVAALATIIMSEGSTGNSAEQIAVGNTVINRMVRNHVTIVSSVASAYAKNQSPSVAIQLLSTELLDGTIADNTNGATHFYFPRSMPRVVSGKLPPKGMDTAGGIETVTGVGYATYRPSWAKTFTQESLQGAREAFFKFYRATGNGAVR